MSTISATAAVPRRTTGRTIWIGLLLLGFAAGVGAWIYQLTQGLAVTNMRNPTMWGLYITLFMFFVGLSAGGLIVASAGRLFGGERLKPIVRVAVLEATVAVMLAALFLLPDMGRPDRLWHLFRYPHFRSPMMWDITVVIAYFIISLIYVWVYTRHDNAERRSWLAFGTTNTPASARRDDRMKWVLAAVGLPVAILLHSITAWIFGLQISRAFWFTALMAPMFVTSALVSGTALVILIVTVVRRVGRISFPDDLRALLAKLLAVFVAVEAFMVFSEMLTAAYNGASFEADPIARMLSGRFSPLFWFEIAVGLLVPFVLLVVPKWRFKPAAVVVASVLAVLGIFVHRFNIVLNGLTFATVPYAPGVAIGTPQPVGTDSFALSLAYYPSWVEWVVALGLVCLGGLIFTAGVMWLPLREKAH